MTTQPNDARLLLLDKHVVESLLLADDVLDATKEAFVLHSQQAGRIFPVVREPLATGGIFGIKSGDVESQSLLGFKAAGFWPANRKLGGEPHQATILLFDPATGRPSCVVDGNAVTTMRTGAAGGLGLKTLARADSRVVCVFGTGVQARVQLDFALRLMPSIRTVRYVSTAGAANPAFEAYFRDRCDIRPVADAETCAETRAQRNAAVAAADIVITATPSREALFDADAVQAGTHINGVGADTRGKRELPEGLLGRARLFVDDHAQSISIGEAQWAPQTASIALGDLLTGAQSFTRTADDITVFDMTGLALQDLTVARMLFVRATAAGVGTSLSWPW